MSKKLVQSKKSMIKKLDLKTAQKKELRRYERPSMKEQLASVKKQLFPKNEPRVIQHEIIAADFNYTKVNPLKLDGWLLWRSAQDKLIVMPENKREDQRYYTFDLEDGTVYMVTKPNAKYAYFHTREFENFIKKYGITRVLRADPNGEYQGRNDVYKNTVSTFRLVSDGDVEEYTTSQHRMDEQPIVAMRSPTVFTVVKNATFVIFEQIAYRKDVEPGSEEDKPFVLRQLVTDYNIYDLEEEIAQACKILDEAETDQDVSDSAGEVNEESAG